jgi:tryptophanyl-tRNA synthetase
MHRAFSSAERVAEVEAGCRSGALGCGDCKMLLADAMLAELDPIREKAEALRADPKRVLGVLQDGAARAREIAASTMSDVRRAMGLTTRAME